MKVAGRGDLRFAKADWGRAKDVSGQNLRSGFL